MSADAVAVLADRGFKDEAELLNLVARVNLVPFGALWAFENWKANDGSKAGLLKLIEAWA